MSIRSRTGTNGQPVEPHGRIGRATPSRMHARACRRCWTCRLHGERDGTSPSPTTVVPGMSARTCNPLNSMTKFVGATLVVARAGPAGCLDSGTGQARPLRPLFPARGQRTCNPLNSMTKFVGATLVVARAGPAGCLDSGTGQARPLRPLFPARGQRTCNPLNSMTKFVGATLVVARAGHAGCQVTGRNKPVPYDLVPCTSASRPRGAVSVGHGSPVGHQVRRSRGVPLLYWRATWVS